MNTGIYHGSDALLYILTDDDPETWTPVGHSTSHSVEVTSELKVRRTKDTGKFPSRKLTGIDAHVNLDALVLYDGYSYEELLTEQLEGNALQLRLRGHTNEDWGVPEEEDDWFLEMDVMIANTSQNMLVNEDGSYICGFDLSGEISIEEVPAP